MLQRTSCVQPLSCDEAFMDVTGATNDARLLIFVTLHEACARAMIVASVTIYPASLYADNHAIGSCLSNRGLYCQALTHMLSTGQAWATRWRWCGSCARRSRRRRAAPRRRAWGPACCWRAWPRAAPSPTASSWSPPGRRAPAGIVTRVSGCISTFFCLIHQPHVQVCQHLFKRNVLWCIGAATRCITPTMLAIVISA